MRRALLSLSVLCLAAACQPAAPAENAAADTAAATVPAGKPAAQAAARAAPAAVLEPVAQRGRRVELVNDARHGKVVRLEVAAIEDRENFREVVPARDLPFERERVVVFGPGCVYDTRAVMEDGVTLIAYRVDVCFRNRVFMGDWPGENQKPWDGAPQAAPQ